MKSLHWVILIITIGIIHARPADDNPELPEAADDNKDNVNPGLDTPLNDKTDDPKDAAADEAKPEGDMPAGDNTADVKSAIDKPTDDNSANSAPVDDKPAEDKPQEDKPADDPAPVDDQPAGDGKPAIDQPADDKPADTADDKSADGKPADVKPADDKPADEHAADDKPADDQPGDDQSVDGKSITPIGEEKTEGEKREGGEGGATNCCPTTAAPQKSATPATPGSPAPTTVKPTTAAAATPESVDKMATIPSEKPESASPTMAAIIEAKPTETTAVKDDTATASPVKDTGTAVPPTAKSNIMDINAVGRSKIMGAMGESMRPDDMGEATGDSRSRISEQDVGQTVEKSNNNTMKMNGTTFRVAVRLLDHRYVGDLEQQKSRKFQSLKTDVMNAVTGVYQGYHDFKQVAVIGFMETPANDSDSDKRNLIAGNSVIADFYLRFFIYGRHLRKLTEAVKSEKLGEITVSGMFVKAYTAEPKGKVCTPDCKIKCYSYCDDGCCNINVVPPNVVTWGQHVITPPIQQTTSSLKNMLEPALKEMQDGSSNVLQIAKQCRGSFCSPNMYQPQPLPSPRLDNSKLQQRFACMGAGCGSPESPKLGAAVCRGPSCPNGKFPSINDFEAPNCVGRLCGTPKPIFPKSSPICQGADCEKSSLNQNSKFNDIDFGTKLASILKSHVSQNTGKSEAPCLRPGCPSLMVRSPCQGISCPCVGPMCGACHMCEDCKHCPRCPNCQNRASIFPGPLQGQELGPSEENMNIEQNIGPNPYEQRLPSIGRNIPSGQQRLTPMEQSLLQQTLDGPDDKRALLGQQHMAFPYNMNGLGRCPSVCRQRCLLSCPDRCCNTQKPQISAMNFAPARMCGLRGC